MHDSPNSMPAAATSHGAVDARTTWGVVAGLVGHRINRLTPGRGF